MPGFSSNLKNQAIGKPQRGRTTVLLQRRDDSFGILHCVIFVMQQHVDRGGYFRISQIVHRSPDA
jgi:hypothetical protein